MHPYPNTTLGYKVAVKNADFFHSRPFIVLYNRAAKYPAIIPMNTYINIPDVIRAPREDGESIPSIAKTKNIILKHKFEFTFTNVYMKKMTFTFHIPHIKYMHFISRRKVEDDP